ncbi:NAD(P)-dependent dehydrogenase, short-chain alcohol dehydrogenase family [Desulfatibacillum alkenivorans DSM 16219]|uniref:NAD(P)-dependent dehydrogenase, short-chain alcohol dehydrogenase family n=1 Tax=Desulfatibacillum alkenivorans DSM 16219 TaxID=1121393 RepID=A0A1M6DUP7_9BACT|nr:SDR family oxidoreductase [Desulfatibacillum alkenivorans]SHI76859.1 NAD(P)-dependent dehydrogenase, short-chain alcohol dehydrogenase family [Desulfatibacillum alkenivorans DSM 16219]
MALNMDAIGKKIGPIEKDYTWKDVVLYALGVGAGFDELDYVYEKDLKVIPSFSIAAVFEFLSHIGANSNVNLAGLLHGEQDLIFHRPIPTSGKLVSEGAVTKYYDLAAAGKKGAIIVGESVSRDAKGKKLFTAKTTLFGRLDGGFGGEAPPKEVVEYPDRDPDFVVEEHPSKDAPLLYRMSGDVFVLHIDPEFAKMSGFEMPIMHGLCTHGYACRALINSLCPGEPEKVRRLKCRFSKTLYPGIPIAIKIWKTGEGTAVWRVINQENGDVVIDQGIFEYGDVVEEQIRYDGRVAVITGAGAGLGKAYALELAKRGAKVVINDLGGSRDGTGASSSAADAVVDEIKAAGGEAVANYDNVATPEGGANVVKTAMDAFGRVDILINNAGILRDKSFLKMEPENWNAVLNVHLNGAYNVTKAAFPIMKQNGFGRIVMTTSAAGLYGNFGQTNYSAAKMALVGFMNTLKLEGNKYNVKVNTVAPLAASRLTEDIMPEEIFNKAKPEYVVPMTLYLCTDECDVTGRIYNVGMGFFNRAAVVTGPGAVLGQGDDIPTCDDVKAAMPKIGSLKDGKEYFELNAQVGDVMMAFQAPPSGGGAAAAGPATPADAFAMLESTFQPDAADGVDVVFQYSISGATGGEWNAVIKDKTCKVSEGKHDKPTTVIIMEDKDFMAMTAGTLNPMQAYTSGKLKIEGDVMKSQLLEKLFKA